MQRGSAVKYINMAKFQFCFLDSMRKEKLNRKHTQAMLHVRPTKTRVSSDSQLPGYTNKAVSKASQTNSSINRLLYRIINAERNVILYVVHLIEFVFNLFILAPTRPIS